MSSKSRGKGRSTSLLKDTRVHDYELEPRGLKTTMVGTDGIARNVIGKIDLKQIATQYDIILWLSFYNIAFEWLRNLYSIQIS